MKQHGNFLLIFRMDVLLRIIIIIGLLKMIKKG
uniref:Uncharacterized protein n=1 Tax=Siphoviridae sp. ctxMM9 TaxID=2827973 RepID=A0A8S5T5Y4_9CAUD|nr:MAG TPA: hypothetical protein [Siphoviridae sp. ctxMM9]